MQVGVSVSFILGPLLVRSGPDVTVDEMRHDVGQACEETGKGLGTGQRLILLVENVKATAWTLAVQSGSGD